MPLKILLIDHSQTIKTVFTLALTGYDYELKTIAKTENAPDIVKQFQPQLIFIDSLTKNLEIPKFIQESLNSMETFIVLLQSSFVEDTEPIAQLIKSKAISKTLKKPFKKQELREIVHPHIYKQNSEEHSTVSMDPIVSWENNLDLEQTEIPHSQPTVTKFESQKPSEKKSKTTEVDKQLQKNILEQLNAFFKEESKTILKEVATPIVQEYVKQQVKILTKDLIEKEIQKMLNQPDDSSQTNQR